MLTFCSYGCIFAVFFLIFVTRTGFGAPCDVFKRYPQGVFGRHTQSVLGLPAAYFKDLLVASLGVAECIFEILLVDATAIKSRLVFRKQIRFEEWLLLAFEVARSGLPSSSYFGSLGNKHQFPEGGRRGRRRGGKLMSATKTSQFRPHSAILSPCFEFPLIFSFMPWLSNEIQGYCLPLAAHFSYIWILIHLKLPVKILTVHK